MIRTQIYLPETLYKDIKRRAKAKGEPAAQLIRDALEQGLNVSSVSKNTPKRRGLAALADELNLTGGPADLSRRIDDYLYGDDK